MKNTALALCAACLLLCAWGAVKVRAAGATEISLDAPPVVLVGSSFSVTVNIQNVTDFSAADMVLTFNGEVMNVTAVENGSIGGVVIPVSAHWEEEQCRLVCHLDSGTASGSGHLAVITFTCRSSGTSVMSVEGNVSDGQGNPVSVSWSGTQVAGTVTRLDVQAPEVVSGPFNASLAISAVDAFSSMNCEVLFDSNVLDVSGVSNGSLGGQQTMVSYAVSGDRLALVVRGEGSGNGSLAHIRFVPHDAGISGICSLNLSNLTISNQQGEPVVALVTNTTVVVESTQPLPPVATFSWSPQWPYATQQITFDGNGSHDPDGGSIINWTWEWGDGTASYGPHVIHSYSAAGVYAVNLTVTDNEDDRNTTTHQIIVKNASTLSTAIHPQGGGDINLDPPGGVYAEGTVVTVTATPASGYRFDHWEGDASGSDASITITMDGDKSITAHFSEISPPQYTLTTSVSPSGSGTITLSPSEGPYDEGTVVTVTATPASGYRFDHWEGDASGSDASQTLIMDENKTVTAYFEPLVQYTLSTEVSPPGAGQVSPPGGTYNQGDTVTLTALANAGYTFAYWSGDASGTSRSIQVTMDQDRQVVAHFQEYQPPPPPPPPQQFTLSTSVSPSGSGTITLDPPGGTYDEGTTVTVTASASEGYVFSHWSGDASGNASTVHISMTSEKSVTAHFSPVTLPNTPPTVTIVSPENNATLSGPVTMNGSAQDSDGSILRVEVRIDGRAWTTAQGTTSWHYAWDAASLGTGEHVLAARSFDGTDYSPVVTRTVYVENPQSDDGTSFPVTIVMAVVAVAGIAGGVLAFYFKRRP